MPLDIPILDILHVKNKRFIKKTDIQMRVENTEQKINWLDLDDYQKANVLEQARAYLHQQIEEAKVSENVKAVLDKHGLI